MFLLSILTIWWLLNRPISVIPGDVLVIGLGFLLLIPILIWCHVTGVQVTKEEGW